MKSLFRRDTGVARAVAAAGGARRLAGAMGLSPQTLYYSLGRGRIHDIDVARKWLAGLASLGVHGFTLDELTVVEGEGTGDAIAHGRIGAPSGNQPRGPLCP